MDFTSSNKEEKSKAFKGMFKHIKNFLGWGEIAQGVLGPFAPKHSAFHKHL